mgnify:CR=1 FL=1
MVPPLQKTATGRVKGVDRLVRITGPDPHISPLLLRMYKGTFERDIEVEYTTARLQQYMYMYNNIILLIQVKNRIH